MPRRINISVDVLDFADPTGYAIGWIVHPGQQQLLWEAAATKVLSYHGMTEDDLEETLGPPEDPSIRDCLLLLLPTLSIPGCEALSLICAEPFTII